MLRKLDEFYNNQQEPTKSCLDALRGIILNYKPGITEEWYYRLPCFFYKGEMFCYLYVDKKNGHPYIAMYPGQRLKHPKLVSGNRTQSKILAIHPEKDIPIKTIASVFKEALSFFK